MNIVKTDGPPVIGTYLATVHAGNVRIDLSGSFEVPDPGSQYSLELAIEFAIKNEIKVTIHEVTIASRPAQEKP